MLSHKSPRNREAFVVLVARRAPIKSGDMFTKCVSNFNKQLMSQTRHWLVNMDKIGFGILEGSAVHVER